MTIKLLNAVILAEDFAAVRDWWVAALGLEIHKEWPDLPYADLAGEGGIMLGIGTLATADVDPPSPRRNSVLPQFVSDDVERLLARVVEHGGTIVFGPNFAEDGGYWYGSFTDIEGNPAWVVSPEAVPE